MNVWTDIAIGNLQRQRPPATDDGVEYRICRTCKESKPEHAFYLKPSRKFGEYFSLDCRACICIKDRETRARNRKPAPETVAQKLKKIITPEPMTVKQLGEAIGVDRRSVGKALDELIAAGLAERCGFASHKYNGCIPAYRLTQSRPGAGERITAP